MLDFNNSLVVPSLFLVLIARESRVKFLFQVALCEKVKNPDIKNARCPLCQKPRALTSTQASSEELALLVKTSPVKVLRCGSTSKSWHTSMSRDANRSRTSSHSSYGQIRLSYTTLHDQRRISCRKDT